MHPVGGVEPLRRLELQITLVDERRGVEQRVAHVAHKAPVGNAPQLGIEGLEQAVKSRAVAFGSTPTDHHSFVLVGALEDKFEHSAYEVPDLDALGQGQQVLRARGHRHLWGLGRHVLGSQLFDYWLDPDGVQFEHFSDGDAFTADHETHYSEFSLASIWAWGHDVPRAMRPRKNLALLWRVLRLLASKRLELSRLKLLGGALAAPARPWL